ncbi:type IV secretion system protein [Caulobacter segnis]|uniref:type IV secretion system protein n=1 Tax=Caulobacter segnis TaxID=88688 RepID=UPI00240FF569|nr:type IV secretion system protein [Caulobacter segnis]MDG2520513.1 type IV secretion system protein [Caulobacter segnis]
METTYTVFSQAYGTVDNRLENFLGDAVQNAIAEMAGPMRVALVLYVLLYGFAILRGAIQEPLMDFAVRSIKLTIIYLLATTPAYGDYVTQPLFHQLPDALSRALGGAAFQDAGGAFDRYIGQTAWLADRITEDAEIWDVMDWLIATAVWICGALAAALGFGIVTVAKVALALIVALGPIFIGLSLFEATRRYFFGWLSQAVNYLVLFALIFAVFQLVLAMVADQWESLQAQDAMAAGFAFIALSLLGSIFFLQTPTLAAGIAGGASLGIADFLNAGRSDIVFSQRRKGGRK